MAVEKLVAEKPSPEFIAEKQRQTRQPVAALSNLAQRECHNRRLPTNVLFERVCRFRLAKKRAQLDACV